VKIDVISGRFQAHPDLDRRVRLHLVFLTPMCLAILWYGIPFFLKGLYSGEMSSNAGGLIRWPVYLMMPLGFGLLCCKACPS
jgi:TRAP-type mannitol/chloroaromatic compound transport system permease small subunit